MSTQRIAFATIGILDPFRPFFQLCLEVFILHTIVSIAANSVETQHLTYS